MTKTLLLLLGITFLSSCSISGLTDGYSKLPEHDKLRVTYLSQGGQGDFLMTNGQRLRSEFKSGEYNVVYYFIPDCSSPNCVPISSVANALPSGVNLFVVTRSLTSDVIALSSKHKIYGMDKHHYNSRYTFKVEERFFNDLTGREDSSQDAKNLYLFYGDTFLRLLDLADLAHITSEPIAEDGVD